MKYLIIFLLCIEFCFGGYCPSGCLDPMVPLTSSQTSQSLYEQQNMNLSLQIEQINEILKNTMLQTETNNKKILKQNLKLKKQIYTDKKQQNFIKNQQNKIQNIINNAESIE